MTSRRIARYMSGRGAALAKASALYPEDEASPAPVRRVRWSHELPVSTSMAIVRLLDTIDIKDCEHCEDLHFALIGFIKGLNPLTAYAPDVLVRTKAPMHRQGHNTKAHLEPGLVAV